MRRLFADALYWIAIANHKDQWHAKSVHVMRSLGQATLVTTEEVLDEFLTYYSGHGPVLRNNAAQTVEDALADPLVIVRPQTHQSFLDGLALNKSRPDKGYITPARKFRILAHTPHELSSPEYVTKRQPPPDPRHCWLTSGELFS